MTELPKRHCRFCGDEFQPVRGHQECCSGDHRIAWHGVRVKMGKIMIDALDDCGYDAHGFFLRLREIVDRFEADYPRMVEAARRAFKED